MATSKGQRVVTFLLALLFLLSIIGGTVYVIWQINQQESGIVEDSTDTVAEDTTDTTSNSCGSKTYDALAPRTLPSVVKVSGDVTSLEKVDVKAGSGETVQAGDCVAALYYGTLAKDGKKFDGNYESGKPIEFSLNGVIAGWTEGIPGMKVGGVRRLVIPSDKAYGSQAQGSIPANSDLIFEVEIIATRRGN